ncbi:MAG: hypothetical protein UV73_C0005G0034 [Candidatus Gottesmanbacteria bacterium GW2011_GWA2_43_14]|uniref:Uncharacterized protein n=1 Tax=Candidatus Gottesmanbacteria bacterium GW2011_GWA2_43_14 TaxID=1618443 RepID=A0A0G1DJL2_9BACT|nr:MAG: hypothetical protein UV73_C0005G0034 [Candidatus Gottesmanbacteria bacterium GW2011_GWA2_43_14]
MRKTVSKKTNGNIFKTIVQGVFREELSKTEKRLEIRLEQRLTKNLSEVIDEKFEENFSRYRNETVNKLDGVIKELKRGYEELTVHLGRHDRTERRLENLEAIHPDGKHI